MAITQECISGEFKLIGDFEGYDIFVLAMDCAGIYNIEDILKLAEINEFEHCDMRSGQFSHKNRLSWTTATVAVAEYATFVWYGDDPECSILCLGRSDSIRVNTNEVFAFRRRQKT